MGTIPRVIMDKIAALLTVHNRRDKTLACIEHLRQQKDDDAFLVDIYLTNDGCTDGTQEAIAERFPDVHIINGDGSLFWNRGMLMAWRAAALNNYDYYLWLNDDTNLYNDTVALLLNCSRKHNEQAIIVGTTCAINNPGLITYGGWVRGALLDNVDEEHQCSTFNGNIVLIPKYVYVLLGTTDPYYHHALGDFDYGLRASKLGIEIWTVQGIMGECNRHSLPTVWKDPQRPLHQRWKNFFSPLGNNPFEFFHFRKKHFGFIPACLTFISNFLHLIFPRFWK